MLPNKNFLSIIIPCYNEVDNIALILSKFTEILQGLDFVELVIVNNGSTDNSAEIFEKSLKELGDDRFRVVTVPENKGYGYGILYGLSQAKGNVLAWTHADMQTDPQDVITAYRVYLQHNDERLFVKGRRRERKNVAAFFSWAMQIISSIALKSPLDDINAQPKLFSRAFYENYLISDETPTDFSLDLYALYKAEKFEKIYNIPVIVSKRLHGEAKGGGSIKTKTKLIIRTFTYIFKLKRSLKI